ncbi:MAG: hypothetical protein NTU64_02385, partial [Hyphomicrobiales bacterium]|nr:hypothetical protein [Hyphomicrobiales bacterium]
MSMILSENRPLFFRDHALRQTAPETAERLMRQNGQHRAAFGKILQGNQLRFGQRDAARCSFRGRAPYMDEDAGPGARRA